MTGAIHRVTILFAAIAAAVLLTPVERKASTELLNEIIDIELDNLAFDINRRLPFAFENVPRDIRELHDRRIRIHGYMYPTFEETGVTEFFLNGETKQKSFHFGVDIERVPIQFYIPVAMRKQTFTGYSQQPIVVEGKLRVHPEAVDGVVHFAYRIEDALVVPTKARFGFHASIGFGC